MAAVVRRPATALSGAVSSTSRPPTVLFGARIQYSDTSVAETSADTEVHIADTTAAHAASAVSFMPAAGIAMTYVQAAIVEDDGNLAAHVPMLPISCPLSYGASVKFRNLKT